VSRADYSATGTLEKGGRITVLCVHGITNLGGCVPGQHSVPRPNSAESGLGGGCPGHPRRRHV